MSNRIEAFSRRDDAENAALFRRATVVLFLCLPLMHWPGSSQGTLFAFVAIWYAGTLLMMFSWPAVLLTWLLIVLPLWPHREQHPKRSKAITLAGLALLAAAVIYLTTVLFASWPFWAVAVPLCACLVASVYYTLKR